MKTNTRRQVLQTEAREGREERGLPEFRISPHPGSSDYAAEMFPFHNEGHFGNNTPVVIILRDEVEKSFSNQN